MRWYFIDRDNSSVVLLFESLFLLVCWYGRVEPVSSRINAFETISCDLEVPDININATCNNGMLIVLTDKRCARFTYESQVFHIGVYLLTCLEICSFKRNEK